MVHFVPGPIPTGEICGLRHQGQLLAQGDIVIGDTLNGYRSLAVDGGNIIFHTAFLTVFKGQDNGAIHARWIGVFYLCGRIKYPA